MTTLIVTVAVVIACAVLATVIALVAGSPRTIKRFGHDLVWVDCTHCTAGSQWLHPDGNWGPFPEEIMRMREGGSYIEAPQVNTRTCPKCQMGGWWRPRKEPK
ncbi:MAG TPA: hypothetical protein VGR71_16745 [Nitrospira sp.]|nr:hypothetical protein [Nitrospira sp.]